MMNQKIAILAVLGSVLLSAAILATPSLNVANAQGNQTGGGMNQTGEMQTQGLPIDTWIKILKDKNPALKDVEQSPNVKDAIGKIKEMKDPKQAVETFNALGALQQLMNIKSAQEAQ
jgi:hypothetical protein